MKDPQPHPAHLHLKPGPNRPDMVLDVWLGQSITNMVIYHFYCQKLQNQCCENEFQKVTKERCCLLPAFVSLKAGAHGLLCITSWSLVVIYRCITELTQESVHSSAVSVIEPSPQKVLFHLNIMPLSKTLHRPTMVKDVKIEFAVQTPIGCLSLFLPGVNKNTEVWRTQSHIYYLLPPYDISSRSSNPNN